MEAREDEDGSLPHARLGLAHDIHTEDRLRDALVLHLRGVLEAAVDHGAEELRLEQEITEARGVDAGVGAALLHLVLALGLQGFILLVIHQVLVVEL